LLVSFFFSVGVIFSFFPLLKDSSALLIASKAAALAKPSQPVGATNSHILPKKFHPFFDFISVLDLVVFVFLSFLLALLFGRPTFLGLPPS
jgi:hypothetical protein